MADVLPIQGGPETAKRRNPVGVAALTLVTLGIYYIFWWYYINREMADLGRKNGREDLGTNPALSVLAVFPGFLLLGIPTIWTTITTYQRAKRAQQLVGVPETQQANPWFYGLLYVIISLVAWGYLQNELNKVWSISAGIGPGAVAGNTPTAVQPPPAAATPAAPEAPVVDAPVAPPAPPEPPTPA
jgi:hypothetical protein